MKNNLNNIKINDTFWNDRINLINQKVIPFQWKALIDQVENAAPSHCITNFQIAAEISKNPQNNNTVGFEGCPWQDSDLYKWIEAVAYSLYTRPDTELEKIADKAIDLVCSAQQPNGYLDTFYIIGGMDKIFSNLKDCHELYCFGHLVECAVAYYESTGKDKLLKAAEKFADFIDQNFGYSEKKKHGYPGHEVAEMALAKLYNITHNKKYLDLAKYFIYERGKKPYYFDVEKNSQTDENDDIYKYEYYQAHKPVIMQDEAVGHAVRAVYLYSGMADVAKLTGDMDLINACKKLWDNIVSKKMYITAGIGSTAHGEAFSFNYDLPNDTAYAETCASVGLVFFARRMLELEIDSKYADVLEKALYNGILSGIALDGESFFYVNPLEVHPESCYKNPNMKHVLATRQKWFGCACCPPNVARLLSSLGNYVYSQIDDKLFLHMYVGSEIDIFVNGKPVKVNIFSNMPWNGKVSISIGCQHSVDLTLCFRIPEWCENNYKLSCEDNIIQIKNGYIHVHNHWKNGDTIHIDFDLQAKLMRANPLVRENIGKVAVVRGPLVYCIEEADNGKNLDLLSLDKLSEFELIPKPELGKNVTAIIAKGSKIQLSDDSLYSTKINYNVSNTKLEFIPYYSWANRGEGEMAVWVRY